MVGAYGHVIILHYNHPAEPGIDASNDEEVMLSKIRQAAESYGKGRVGDPVLNTAHHIKVNSEITKEYFTMLRYLDQHWPGQGRHVVKGVVAV